MTQQLHYTPGFALAAVLQQLQQWKDEGGEAMHLGALASHPETDDDCTFGDLIEAAQAEHAALVEHVRNFAEHIRDLRHALGRHDGCSRMSNADRALIDTPIPALLPPSNAVIRVFIEGGVLQEVSGIPDGVTVRKIDLDDGNAAPEDVVTLSGDDLPPWVIEADGMIRRGRAVRAYVGDWTAGGSKTLQDEDFFCVLCLDDASWLTNQRTDTGAAVFKNDPGSQLALLTREQANKWSRPYYRVPSASAREALRDEA